MARAKTPVSQITLRKADGEPRSTDCGPKDVRIENVEGQGITLDAAIKTAHANARTAGQASCEGTCPAPKLCKYLEASWTVTSSVRANDVWTVKGTSAGTCHCE